jgi:hypothetical protein
MRASRIEGTTALAASGLGSGSDQLECAPPLASAPSVEVKREVKRRMLRSQR